MTSAFNQLAESYDQHFSHTVLGQYYRERVQQNMLEYWPGERDILEINAGTGEDALFLAEKGNRVLATDLSPKMVSMIDKKVKHRLVTTQVLDIEQLQTLQGQSFDGILSNFGGLNCIEDIETFVADAASLLKPNGVLIITLMGRWVPWEWGYFACHGQFSKAARRCSGKATWRQQTIYYPRMSTVKKQLKEHFKLLHQQGLGITMPPSYVSETVVRWPRLFRFLAAVENGIARWSPLAHLADHYLLVYQKNGKETL
jgi:ubiquinone/menaquinone biosynthesis C-methylase UbiE